MAGEADKALGQIAALIRQVANRSLQGPAAVVALKAARRLAADRPAHVGRLAPALLAVASSLTPGTSLLGPDTCIASQLPAACSRHDAVPVSSDQQHVAVQLPDPVPPVPDQPCAPA